MRSLALKTTFAAPRMEWYGNGHREQSEMLVRAFANVSGSAYFFSALPKHYLEL